ncbi:helix-turn-helix domain-containing protein [Oligoflexus sp.]|uniref:helix-turn-helix domain-containing protein n=1 Tax=Oligoflexus sp. TaxID=1971216 RepID=UPI0039C9AF86
MIHVKYLCSRFSRVMKKNSTSPSSIVKKLKVISKNVSAYEAEDRIFDNWITKKDLAAHIGMSVSFVNKYMKDGLPFRRRGRSVRFRVLDVEEWLQRRFAQ